MIKKSSTHPQCLVELGRTMVAQPVCGANIMQNRQNSEKTKGTGI